MQDPASDIAPREAFVFKKRIDVVRQVQANHAFLGEAARCIALGGNRQVERIAIAIEFSGEYPL